MTARRVSYLVAVGMNVLLLCFNLAVLGLQWWHGAGLPLANEAAAGLCAIGLWAIIATEGHIVTRQATIDSYLLEQEADTKMKQFMVKKLESGEAGLALTTSPTAPPTGRAH